jgi:hypothetical protein
MAQLRVLPGPQEQPQQESHRVSQQLAFELADVRVDERWSPKQTQTLGRTAVQQDAPPGFPEWHWVPPVSPQQKARYCPGPL